MRVAHAVLAFMRKGMSWFAVSLAISLLLGGLIAVATPLAMVDAGLWIAQSRGTSGVSTDTGSVLVEIPLQNVRAVAADSERGTVWTLTKNGLYVHDRAGSQLRRVELVGPQGEPAFVKLDPATGSAWVAIQSQILAMAARGLLASAVLSGSPALVLYWLAWSPIPGTVRRA